jgi:hypothetical protein
MMSLGTILKTLLCAMVVAGGFVGCVAPHDKTSLGSSFVRTRAYSRQPKYNGDRVKVFVSSRPSRRYSEVGVITVRDHDYPRVVWFARHKAAKAGCDAILQISTGRVMAEVSGYAMGGIVSGTAEYDTVGRFSCLILDKK